MNGRIYEDKEDLENEERLIQIANLKWNCASKKESMANIIDYSMWRNGVLLGWVEIRVRNAKSTDYPTIICSLNKAETCIRRRKNFGKPVIFLVKWKGDNKIGWIDFKDVDYKDEKTLWYQPINYRNDKRDIGTVVQIPINKFHWIEDAL
tara:strand:+ start:24055 stop:24504 length:450 start_codon:yes stop_codon:yes gene_type:complete